MIVDANVVYGFDRLQRRDMTPEAILKIMDKHSIDKAIITSNKCMYFDFREGNEDTAKLVSRYPDRFIGFLSFHVARYIGVVEEVERAVHQLGLRGIRLFNTEITFGQGWSSGLKSLVLAEVMKRANELKLPVFIEPGYLFYEIKAFAEKYRNIKVIASGAGYPNMGEAILAAKITPNLYLDITGLEAACGVDFLVESLGVKKIIFGTGMPMNVPSIQIEMVRHASISAEEKNYIFCKNIQQIIGDG